MHAVLHAGADQVFVHCAGGLGRTGDIAFALADILSDTAQHRTGMYLPRRLVNRLNWTFGLLEPRLCRP
jgi:protein tyrosine phosphatase